MDNLPVGYTKWTDRLAMDIALLLEKSGETLDEVLARHKITVLELGQFNQDPIFLKKVDALRTEVRDKGLTFRMKARAQAEELLTTSWIMIHSLEVSPAVKADLIKQTVKWADLEPKGDTGEGAGAGGVTISINLNGQTHTATMKDATPNAPTTIEHEAEESQAADGNPG